jgi:hypothetical protein
MLVQFRGGSRVPSLPNPTPDLSNIKIITIYDTAARMVSGRKGSNLIEEGCLRTR